MVRAVQGMEEESSWLRGELKELKAVADNSLPEMNHGVDEENDKLRAELDAIKGEIELRVDRIQELKECRTDLHFSKVEKEEMEAINAKVIQLEKQLEQKEAQESAICLLNTKLQAGENLRMEEYEHLYKLLTILKECLEQKSERFQNAYVDLTQRDHLNRNELQETRQEVIKVNVFLLTFPIPLYE
ncbi:factor of DNA methylation 2-like [Panicum miliaceum]|uniref:Factor of DNA methylation 2-like n=1 Tax=Panicum miliaceum TaxID=4540 RepID=A0A3L6QW89_PANMI|nr:factor of DNA methylation 2-like [Panicum miliaceum]